MVITLPGARRLFSMLQEAFRHKEKGRQRLRLSKAVHGFLDDFYTLAQDIASRPTRIAELIPNPIPTTLGACDTAGVGIGGIDFIPAIDGSVVPILWRHKFPEWVQQDLVSFGNPDGSINNSDLELTGSIAHNDVLAQYKDVQERTIHNSYDNILMVFWQQKGSMTTTGPAAYLLRLQAFHQRFFRYVPLKDFIPGSSNTIVNILSRRWDLSDNQLFAFFNSHFP